MRLDQLITDPQATTGRLLPEQFLVDQVAQRGLAQLFIGLGIADAAHGTALCLQVLGEVAFKAKFGNCLAIDPRSGWAIVVVVSVGLDLGHHDEQSDEQTTELHDRSSHQGAVAIG